MSNIDISERSEAVKNLISASSIIVFWGLSKQSCYRAAIDHIDNPILVHSMRDISRIKPNINVVFDLHIYDNKDLNSIVFERRIRKFHIDSNAKIVLVMNTSEYHNLWNTCQPIINSNFALINVSELYSGDNNPKYLNL